MSELLEHVWADPAVAACALHDEAHFGPLPGLPALEHAPSLLLPDPSPAALRAVPLPIATAVELRAKAEYAQSSLRRPAIPAQAPARVLYRVADPAAADRDDGDFEFPARAPTGTRLSLRARLQNTEARSLVTLIRTCGVVRARAPHRAQPRAAQPDAAGRPTHAARRGKGIELDNYVRPSPESCDRTTPTPRPQPHAAANKATRPILPSSRQERAALFAAAGAAWLAASGKPRQPPSQPSPLEHRRSLSIHMSSHRHELQGVLCGAAGGDPSNSSSNNEDGAAAARRTLALTSPSPP